MLATTVGKIWLVLSEAAHLRANEKSMLPKIVFSFLIWISGLSLIAITTIVFLTDSMTSISDYVNMSITYSSFYTFNVLVTNVNLLLAAAYLWWLSVQKLVNRNSSSIRDHSVRDDAKVDW
jgi:hypothetical protein